MSEGIFVKNTTVARDVIVQLFVRADTWYYHDTSKYIMKADNPFKGSIALSLAAPIILGKFSDD